MKINLKNYLKFIFSYSKKHMFLYFASLILSIFSSISTLLLPILSKSIIDNVLSKKSPEFIINGALIVIASFIFIALVNVLLSYVQSSFFNKVNYLIKLDFFNKIQKSFFYQNLNKYASEIYYRMMKDGTILFEYYCKISIDLISNIFLIIIIISFMFRWSIILTIFSIIMTVSQIILILTVKKPLSKIANAQRSLEQDITVAINQGFGESEIVKLLGLEKRQYFSIKEKFKSAVKIFIKNSFVQSIINYTIRFSNQLWSAILLIIGSGLILNNEITIGSLLSFYILIGLFYSPSISIVNTISLYPETKVSFKRFLEFYLSIDPAYTSKTPFSFEKELKFNNINFKYEDKEIFSNLNLTFFPGEIIAITGKSGSGKSTFVKLISRLLLPDTGCITLDGININEINNSDFRKNVGVLSQTPYILNETLRDNLALWDKNISDEYILEIMKEVGLENMCQDGKSSLNMILGAKGRKVSLGESQKINIARILMHKPKIIILDEPTSSLDKDSEILITNVIEKFNKKFKSLFIIISHSEKPVKIATRIIQIN